MSNKDTRHPALVEINRRYNAGELNENQMKIVEWYLEKTKGDFTMKVLKSMLTELKDSDTKEPKKTQKKPDTFKYTMPVTTLAEAYNITPSKFKELFNVAGDTLYLNESDLKSFESRAGKIFNPSKGKFTLKPDDKEKYNDAIVEFRNNIENELWSEVERYKNTLTDIRPEIKDSLNNVIKVAKNPKIPQVKKEGWLSKAWNTLSTAWDKNVQHYK
tara:strand:+ start:89 stop:736 length:648 start_codon:yes stop_codon:yes gene_type:complete